MMILVTYDVSTQDETSAKRLRQVARQCRNYGQRVQYSVFEIEVDPAQWTMLKAKLEGIINPETDSLRYYYLGKNWQHKVEHIGAKPVLDLNDVLLF
jgi:CRISPR-associated protein Cas2|nr:CRISPR-associated endonuclease Cas2 [uncultured Moraxella sp.]